MKKIIFVLISLFVFISCQSQDNEYTFNSRTGKFDLIRSSSWLSSVLNNGNSRLRVKSIYVKDSIDFNTGNFSVTKQNDSTIFKTKYGSPFVLDFGNGYISGSGNGDINIKSSAGSAVNITGDGATGGGLLFNGYETVLTAPLNIDGRWFSHRTNDNSEIIASAGYVDTEIFQNDTLQNKLGVNGYLRSKSLITDTIKTSAGNIQLNQSSSVFDWTTNLYDYWSFDNSTPINTISGNINNYSLQPAYGAITFVANQSDFVTYKKLNGSFTMNAASAQGFETVDIFSSELSLNFWYKTTEQGWTEILQEQPYYIEVRQSTMRIDLNYGTAIDITGIWNINDWNQITLTNSLINNQIKVYVNGVLLIVSSYIDGTSTRITSRGSAGIFPAWYDELSIFDGRILSGAEANILYNNGTGVFYSLPDPAYLQSAIALNLTNSAASTSSTTGALSVIGGVGIGGNINVSGLTNKFTSTIESNTISDGSIIVSGGIGVAKNINSGGFIKSFNTQQSQTSGSGSIITNGGLGVAKRINAAGNIKSDSTILLNNNIGNVSRLNIVGNATITSSSNTDPILFLNHNGFRGIKFAGTSEGITIESATSMSAVSDASLGVFYCNNAGNNFVEFGGGINRSANLCRSSGSINAMTSLGRGESMTITNRTLVRIANRNPSASLSLALGSNYFEVIDYNSTTSARDEKFLIDNKGNTIVKKKLTTDTFLLSTSVYDDLVISGVIGNIGIAAPALRAFKGSAILKRYALAGSVANEDFNIDFQIPHSAIGDSSLLPHIHLSPETTAGATDSAVLVFTYSMANINSVFSNEIRDTLKLPLNNIVAWSHIIASFKRIQNTSGTISRCIAVNVQRLQNHPSDNYANFLHIISIDMHIRKNKIGSAASSF